MITDEPGPGWDALTCLGADPGWRASAQEAARGLAAGTDLALARVARRDRDRVVVLTAPDSPRTLTLPGAMSGEDLTTGDWVLAEQGAVLAVLPRRTAVVRGAGRRDARAQTVAANVDVVLVVHALTEPPNAGRLERLLSLVLSGGARPVVVLTKCDLRADLAGELAEARSLAPGVAVLAASAVTGDGVDDLRAMLTAGSTVAALGRSGAGKSSLLNALAGTELFGTAEVRADGKGRHTTTVRELVPLPRGPVLLDTPGLRGVQLWQAEDGLEQVFPEVADLGDQCRFRDCGHASEPGCAVLAAVAAGVLPLRRLESWRHLQRENAALARRHDARLASQARKVWAQRTREARSRERHRLR